MSSNQFDSFGQLGSLLGEFGWNKGRAKAVLTIWLFMFFLSLPMSLLLIGLPGLILSSYFSYRSFQRLKGTKPVILLYQKGLIDCRKGTPEIIRYEEIKKLFLSVVITNGILNYVLTLETQNAGKIKIDEHIANVERLRVLLEEQIIQIKLPALIANYQQGNAIEFGQLTLTQEGLFVGKRMLPLSEFELAEVKRSSKSVYLLIYQKVARRSGFAFLAMTFQIWLCFLHLSTLLRLQKFRLKCLNLNDGFRVWKEQEERTKVILCSIFSAILNSARTRLGQYQPFDLWALSSFFCWFHLFLLKLSPRTRQILLEPLLIGV
jgi:hypothetical protein